MSSNGQPAAAASLAPRAVAAAVFPMAPGARFDWHTHNDHQLAWASNGVLTVLTDSATWVLPPTRALWIPAGLPHEVRASGSATMRPLYIRPDRWSSHWDRPTAVAARAVLADMIAYLYDESLDPPSRARAEAVLEDLLQPVEVATIEIRSPLDERAQAVAAGLVADPADRRTLESWGRDVGASGRTLARLFLNDTGLSFGKWRTLTRLRASLPALAAGQPISTIAKQVGYDSSSAFVAAFHRETGLTPAAYFQNK